MTLPTKSTSAHSVSTEAAISCSSGRCPDWHRASGCRSPEPIHHSKYTLQRGGVSWDTTSSVTHAWP